MIDPKHLTLARLLEGRLFRIPEYQRAYSWTTRERKDLFGDILTVVNDVQADMTHYMATVVVLRRDKKKILADEFEVVDVVDGQQRLTTLVLLLRAICKRLSDAVVTEQKLKRQLNELLVKGDELSLLLSEPSPQMTPKISRKNSCSRMVAS